MTKEEMECIDNDGNGIDGRDHFDHFDVGTSSSSSSSRRLAIHQIASFLPLSMLTVITQQVSPSLASTITETSTSTGTGAGTVTSISPTPNLQCLTDLPPIPKDCIRVFLCRHGQTENNRLRLVQGARVDPPLNDTGRRQAVRLGECLFSLKEQMKMETATAGDFDFPTIVMHSKLQRARETATILSLIIGNASASAIESNNGDSVQLSEDEDLKYINGILPDIGTSTTTTTSSSTSTVTASTFISTNDISPDKIQVSMSDYTNTLKLEYLSSIGEVDFGAVEGKSVNEAKAEMMATYSQWAVGKIDATNGDDGESGRTVLRRVASTLNSLVDDYASQSQSRSVAVVSHSTYLRMLLSLVLDTSLLKSASMEQKNCCVNVLDVSLKEKREVLFNSPVWGGKLSLAPRDFRLVIPKATVVRMNEIRHLEGLL